ncbi:diphosphomevalonate decarboxylase [Cooperia oncophora]
MVTTDCYRTVEVEVPINIALVKYWGKKDEDLIIPINNSISLNVDALCARTRVQCSPSTLSDSVTINGVELDLDSKKNRRFRQCLNCARELVRQRSSSDAGQECSFQISSTTNFPVGAGLASSAAGFAAIAFAIGTLFDLPVADISALARRGSGSACRSVYGGLVEWEAGMYAFLQRLPETTWPELRVVVLVLDDSEKEVGSSEGMRRTVLTSELMHHRANVVVPERIRRLIHAFQSHDFSEFGRIVMADSNQLHAVCMDSFPPLKYLSDASWHVIRTVNEFNAESGIRAAYTFDAGPNACVFVEEKDLKAFLEQLCQQFVVAEDIVANFSQAAGDFSCKAAPRTSFAIKNVVVSKVGGPPRTVS